MHYIQVIQYIKNKQFHEKRITNNICHKTVYLAAVIRFTRFNE
jgi:hypothetical protein